MREADALVRLRGHGIDAVPHGWTVSKVKYLAAYTNGYPFKPDQWGTAGKPIIRIQNLTDPSAEPNRFEGNLDECYAVEAGDFLISWSASLGLHVWQGEPAWLNQHIFRVELNGKCLPHYFRWLATWFMSELDRDAHGSTMQHLTKDAFGGFPLLLPPASAQAAIAEHLDAATAKLDSLLAEKQALLELLAEKRRALITRAVTQGINPDATRRDSGIAWLGEVPAHWRVERAKHLFAERDDRSETGEEELLTVSHLTGVTSRAEKDVNMFLAESLEGYKRCKAGDLVINTLWAWMGAMGIARQPGIVSPAYNVYQPLGEIDPEYLDLLVRTPRFAEEVTRYSKGVWSSRLRLYPEGLYEVWFPLPPVDEQQAIVSHVQAEIRKLDALAAATRCTVELLQERRSALISAAVTGQMEMEQAHAGK